MGKPQEYGSGPSQQPAYGQPQQPYNPTSPPSYDSVVVRNQPQITQVATTTPMGYGQPQQPPKAYMPQNSYGQPQLTPIAPGTPMGGNERITPKEAKGYGPLFLSCNCCDESIIQTSIIALCSCCTSEIHDCFCPTSMFGFLAPILGCGINEYAPKAHENPKKWLCLPTPIIGCFWLSDENCDCKCNFTQGIRFICTDPCSSSSGNGDTLYIHNSGGSHHSHNHQAQSNTQQQSVQSDPNGAESGNTGTSSENHGDGCGCPDCCKIAENCYSCTSNVFSSISDCFGSCFKGLGDSCGSCFSSIGDCCNTRCPNPEQCAEGTLDFICCPCKVLEGC